MKLIKIKNDFDKLKSTLHKEGKQEMLEDLHSLYESRVSVVTSCKGCSSFQPAISPLPGCAKHNQIIEDPSTIPDFCKKDTFEEWINKIDEVRKDAYIRAHFHR